MTKLQLSGRTISVETSRWDENTPCVSLVYDDTSDHRTPSLTAQEARDLAVTLTLAAERIEQ